MATLASFNQSALIGARPLVVQFTDTSTADNGITEWYWEFGDGSTSALQNPMHVYPAVGEYAVRLTVFSPNGQAAAKGQVIVQEPPAPAPVDPRIGKLVSDIRAALGSVQTVYRDLSATLWPEAIARGFVQLDAEGNVVKDAEGYVVTALTQAMMTGDNQFIQAQVLMDTFVEVMAIINAVPESVYSAVFLVK